MLVQIVTTKICGWKEIVLAIRYASCPTIFMLAESAMLLGAYKLARILATLKQQAAVSLLATAA